MVIVEACINPRVPYLLFKIFRAVECVRARWVEDGTADSEVHGGSSEIAFLNSRYRPAEAKVVLRVHAAEEGVCSGGRQRGRQARRFSRAERWRHWKRRT